MRFHLLLFGLVLSIHYSRGIYNTAEFRNYIGVLKNCTEENGITVEIYAKASKHNANDGDEDGAYEKSKCVDACMFKFHGIMKEDGTIDVEKALEHLLSGRRGQEHRELMRSNIERCSALKETSDCDTAHNLMNCALGYH